MNISTYPINPSRDIAEIQHRKHSLLCISLFPFLSSVSSVAIAEGYCMNKRGSIPGRGNIILFSILSRPALGTTQPPIQWILGDLSSGKMAKA
jgi:hypothetical protein